MSSNISINRLCQYCGNTFIAKTTTTRYCSKQCNRKLYKAQIRNNKIEVSNIETKQIINKPIEELKAKEFLSVKDTCMLLGISHRTIYRLLQRKDIIAGKIGKRTIIKRTEIDKLFIEPPQKPEIKETQPEQIFYDETDCYRLKDVQLKYNISETALQQLVKRENVPKFKSGIHSFVPKIVIDKLLS